MMDARTVLICKLEALALAMVEAAFAMRLYDPDNIEMRRHARALDEAAGKTNAAIGDLRGCER